MTYEEYLKLTANAPKMTNAGRATMSPGGRGVMGPSYSPSTVTNYAPPQGSPLFMDVATPNPRSYTGTGTDLGNTYGRVPGEIGVPSMYGLLAEPYKNLAATNKAAQGFALEQMTGQYPADEAARASGAFGQATGFGGSPYAKAFGMNRYLNQIEARKNQGVTNAQNLMRTTQATQTTDPALIAQIQAANAVTRSAPNPQDATEQMIKNYMSQLNPNGTWAQGGGDGAGRGGNVMGTNLAGGGPLGGSPNLVPSGETVFAGGTGLNPPPVTDPNRAGQVQSMNDNAARIKYWRDVAGPLSAPADIGRTGTMSVWQRYVASGGKEALPPIPNMPLGSSGFKMAGYNPPGGYGNSGSTGGFNPNTKPPSSIKTVAALQKWMRDQGATPLQIATALYNAKNKAPRTITPLIQPQSWIERTNRIYPRSDYTGVPMGPSWFDSVQRFPPFPPGFLSYNPVPRPGTEFNRFPYWENGRLITAPNPNYSLFYTGGQ